MIKVMHLSNLHILLSPLEILSGMYSFKIILHQISVLLRFFRNCYLMSKLLKSLKEFYRNWRIPLTPGKALSTKGCTQ